MEEEWKAVPGYDGWYEVSSLGRVRSWRKRSNQFRIFAERRDEPMILKPSPAKGGYLRVTFHHEGVRSYHTVSRLVLKTFTGLEPDGLEACHGNGVNTDNSLSNLRWDTPVNNAADKKLHGTQIRGERQPTAKLTEMAVKHARELWATGDYTCTELGKRFGVARTTIHTAITGKTWQHIPM